MAEEVEEIENGDESKDKKKTNPLMIIIIVVVVILIILIGVVIAILLSGGEEIKEESVKSGEQAPTEQVQTKTRKVKSINTVKSFKDMGPMFPLDDFIVNLLSEGGKRYLKVSITLELSGEELAAELDSKQAAIRSVIIDILTDKSIEEISTVKGKDKLKEQIVDALNERLSDGHINNVYFTKFVIQ